MRTSLLPSALPLSLDDLEASVPRAPQVVNRIRDSHHQLARLVAEGVKHVEISFITGYSTSHISILQNDPAFQELVEHYRSVAGAKFEALHERIASLGTDTIQEIHNRLNEKPDDFSVSALTELAKLTLDRSGFGPTKTVNQTSITAQVTAADLQRIRGQKTKGEVRQIGQKKANEKAPDAERVEGHSSLPVIDHTPLLDPEVSLAGLEGRGDQVREEVRSQDADRVSPGPSLPRPVG